MTPTPKTTEAPEQTLESAAEPEKTQDNLPAVPEPVGALALPTEDPWADVDSGYAGHGAVGLSLPRLASDMRPGGCWTDEMSGEKLQTLDIVWLAWTESRAWWSQPFGQGSDAPDCRSNDTLHPDQSSPMLQSESCGTCPHSKWNADEPPACGLRVNVLAYLVDERRLARLSFGGTALKHVSRYIGGLRAMVPPRPPMAFVTHVELEEVDDGKMRWLEPRFSVGASVDREEARPLIGLRDEFTAQWRSLLAEDLSRPEAGAEQVRRGPGPFEDAVDAEAREPFTEANETLPTRGDPGPSEPALEDEPDF